ncbi:hypothetical protein OIO90_004732 [Microbotryomycetes sp. JL221]|nr:hypothetical protein OIO90_004732 [Microbotryomycetes sp. JL221]
MEAKELHVVSTSVEAVQIAYDFVNVAEEQYLISKVDAVGSSSVKLKAWQSLNGRRSMYWGGSLTKNGSLVPAPLPDFMDRTWPNVMQRIERLDIFRNVPTDIKGKGKAPNHCLVNEYLPGQGIMPHTDGPAYFPLVATLSLGSHAVLKLVPRSVDELREVEIEGNGCNGSRQPHACTPFTVFLPPRSLVVLSDTIYSNYLHSIEPIKLDSMQDLMACTNWDDWWLKSAGGLTSELEQAKTGAASVEPSDQGDENRQRSGETFQSKEELVQEVVARRRMVESAQGWERARRISLTCRRVDKVVKGLRP